jgi:hypothetical protein
MRSWVLALLSALGAADARAITAISSCDPVQFTGAGIITVDLDCSASALSVTIVDQGTLDFQGHMVTNATIECEDFEDFHATCAVRGPGTLVGGIDSLGALRVEDLTIADGGVSSRRMRVQNVDISGVRPGGSSDDCAIELRSSSRPAKLRVIDSTVTNAACGVDAAGNTTISGSQILNSVGRGITVVYAGYGGKLRLSESTVSGSGDYGVSGIKVLVADSTISDNAGTGVFSSSAGDYEAHLSIQRSVVSGNDSGVGMDQQNGGNVTDSTVTNNVRFGIRSFGPTRVRASQVTGNGTSAECAVTIPCADIGAADPPVVDGRSTCDASYVEGSGIPGTTWGVCTQD